MAQIQPHSSPGMVLKLIRQQTSDLLDQPAKISKNRLLDYPAKWLLLGLPADLTWNLYVLSALAQILLKFEQRIFITIPYAITISNEFYNGAYPGYQIGQSIWPGFPWCCRSDARPILKRKLVYDNLGHWKTIPGEKLNELSSLAAA